MHNHMLFIGNVLAHWVAFMSSIVSFTLGIVEYVRDRRTEGWIFAGIAFLFLLVACDAAWQDEHRNSQLLIADKSSLASDKEFWKAQSYEKDTSLRARDELLTKNYSVLSDTQSSLANLSNRLLDISEPLPRKIDVMRWAIPVTYTFVNVGKVKFWVLVVITNKDLIPVRGDLSCDSDFTVIAENVLTHQTSLRADYTIVSPRQVHIEFVYPPVNTQHPLVFFVSTKEGTDINACSFNLEK